MLPVAVVTVKTERKDDTVLLRLKGDITGPGEEIVAASFKKLDQRPVKHVVLDFNQTPYINSSGIATVIPMQAQRVGQDVECTGLTPHFIKVFNLMGPMKYARLSSRS